jgi:Kef-type K+ transport system membrane component KefB
MVGLNLNPKVIREIGKPSLITGVGQVLFATITGYFIGKTLGFTTVESMFLGIAISFSSTIIIMKLLSDKKDLETLYGRIAIGFLIVQDLIAITILMAITTFHQGGTIGQIFLLSVVKGAMAISGLYLVSKHVMSKIMDKIASSQEFLVLFSISWCFIIATLFHYLGFSIESGALLAGITLSPYPYHFEISARMKPLRDFFIILFFITLGTQMAFSHMKAIAIPALIFSLFIIIINPLIVMILMGRLGYTKRNAFLAGITVAQISEFSLILVALGVDYGQLSGQVLSLITVVAVITMTVSTYLITYSDKIYQRFSRYLSIFEKKGPKMDEHKYHKNPHHDIVLIGYNRIGYDILESLKKLRKKIIIIDHDPQVVIELSKKGFECRYGDADDSEMLDSLCLEKAKMLISTIPDIDTSLLVVKKARQANPKAIITVLSHQIDEALQLYEEGATYVIMPHFLGGKHVSTMIEKNQLNTSKFLKDKVMHLEHLHSRKQ